MISKGASEWNLFSPEPCKSPHFTPRTSQRPPGGLQGLHGPGPLSSLPSPTHTPLVSRASSLFRKLADTPLPLGLSLALPSPRGLFSQEFALLTPSLLQAFAQKSYLILPLPSPLSQHCHPLSLPGEEQVLQNQIQQQHSRPGPVKAWTGILHSPFSPTLVGPQLSMARKLSVAEQQGSKGSPTVHGRTAGTQVRTFQSYTFSPKP